MLEPKEWNNGDQTIFLDQVSGTIRMDSQEPEQALEIVLSEQLVDRRKGIDEKRPNRTLRMEQGQRVLFGRIHSDDEANEEIDDGTVSGRHLWLNCDGDAVYVGDGGSSNGTKLNGERIAPGIACQLMEGDQVTLGRTTLQVESIRTI